MWPYFNVIKGSFLAKDSNLIAAISYVICIDINQFRWCYVIDAYERFSYLIKK